MANKEWEAFEATFKRILSAIIPENVPKGMEETYAWIKRLILYNVPHGKRNRGLAVVDTYKLIAEQLKRVPKEDELELSRVLGWNVEFLQAYFLVVDDMMDESITRRGQKCWYKLDDVGLIACNDAIILDQENYHFLQIFFRDKPYYKHLVDLMHEISRLTAYGQCMDASSNPPNKDPNYTSFTKQRYNSIIKYKTAYYSFVLPVRLAMYMSSIDSEEEHRIAEEILLKIGHLFQCQDDFLDCWGDPAQIGKIGTDIEDGKCCWPIVTAFGLCTPEQYKVLIENYAKKDPNYVQKVKDIYNELKLKELFEVEEETLYKDICAIIDNRLTSSQLNPKIFRQFLDKIYKRKK